MIELIKITELNYIKEFTTFIETNETILFSDDNLPGMDHHNFCYVKENLSKETLKHTVNEEINRRYKNKLSSAFFISDFQIDKTLFDQLPYEVSYYTFDYLYRTTNQMDELKVRSDFSVEPALTREVLADGIRIDIEANKIHMGDFAEKRIQRKAEIYSNHALKTNLFVGYHNQVCIGNCELYIDNNIAKLEDFDIVESYQKQGFGTSFLSYLLSLAHQKVDTLYLVTDAEDTAKDMYYKCGFEKAGSKYEVYIDFNKPKTHN